VKGKGRTKVFRPGHGPPERSKNARALGGGGVHRNSPRCRERMARESPLGVNRSSGGDSLSTPKEDTGKREGKTGVESEVEKKGDMTKRRGEEENVGFQ